MSSCTACCAINVGCAALSVCPAVELMTVAQFHKQCDPCEKHALLYWNMYVVQDSSGVLTDLGRQMARLPVDPPLAATLLAAVELQCASDAVAVVALLSSERVFQNPSSRCEVCSHRCVSQHNNAHATGLLLSLTVSSWHCAGRRRQQRHRKSSVVLWVTTSHY